MQLFDSARTVKSQVLFCCSVIFFCFFPPLDAMLLMLSVWMWSTHVSRCGLLLQTLPAPASSTSSAQTSGLPLSPGRMWMRPWFLSSCIRCARSWLPTLGRSPRRTSRTTLFWFTRFWTVCVGVVSCHCGCSFSESYGSFCQGCWVRVKIGRTVCVIV